MPNPIQTIRSAIYFINIAGRSGKKILRLIVPIISVVATVVQEIKRKN
ncbi:MAG: hypothetical protein WCS31_13685 [Verrucomicrobiae bacterium]